MKTRLSICLILGFSLASCTSDKQKLSILQPPPNTQSTAKQAPDTPVNPSNNLKTIAKVGDERITMADLQPALIEAAGGQVLNEKIMSMKLRNALGKTLITQQQIQDERQIFLATLHDNPQMAEQLLIEVRQRQGLGDGRFADFLFRQAALRHLVQSEVTVNDEAIRQAYELRYGPTSVVQVITVDNPTLAVQILNKARSGEDFGLLVQQYSKDAASKAANGLLQDVSPMDASYPTAMHSAIAKLAIGQISDVVALDNGFAILKLVSKNQRQSVTLDDVKASLAVKVRRNVEQMLMRQLATTLMRQADVVVLDRELNRSWQMSNRNLPQESAKP